MHRPPVGKGWQFFFLSSFMLKHETSLIFIVITASDLPAPDLQGL